MIKVYATGILEGDDKIIQISINHKLIQFVIPIEGSIIGNTEKGVRTLIKFSNGELLETLHYENEIIDKIEEYKQKKANNLILD